MTRFMHFLCTLSTAVMLMAGTTHATTVERLNVTQLVDRADAIVTGTVLGNNTVPSGDGKFVFTYVTFRVSEVLKGRPDSTTITLRLHGGEFNGHGVRIDGMPTFVSGHSYLLFVEQNGRAACPLLGWGQGMLEFSSDSGRSVLLDERGAPILGLQANEWLLGAPQHPAVSRLTYVGKPAADIRIDRQEGVKVSPVSPEVPARADNRKAMDASRVITLLRTLIRDRASTREFRAGQTMTSANPSDVPWSVTGAATAAGRR